MITPLDNQPWSSELVTGNAQFIELGSTIYVVSQVRADNTFAVFKSEPSPPQPGPGSVFATTTTYSFPRANPSFDPVIAYDSVGEILYIVGTQTNVNGTDYDVIIFPYHVANDTLGSPVTLVTASYVRDSYDVCTLDSPLSPPGLANPFIAVSITNPVQVWGIPAMAEVSTPLAGSPPTIPYSAITIDADVLTVYGNFPVSWIGKSITFSGLQNATFLNGVTIVITSVGVDSNGNTYFAADYTYSNYTQVGYESGFASWLSGHTLLGIELSLSSSPLIFGLVGITVLDSSPFRSGNTFGAVSAYSPNGSDIEVYYESHPKQVTFKDQTFSLNLASFGTSPPGWNLPSTVLKTFSGRYADSRLTVVAQGTTRTLLQQFYNQLVHQNALVGNFLFGYYDGVTEWNFLIQPGTATTSYIQGTLSVSETQEAFVSYLAEPIYDIRGMWSPQVKTYNVNDKTAYDGIDYVANQTVTYAYAGAWAQYIAYAAGSVVQVTAPTYPVSYAYYTAKVNVPPSTISPNLDTVNWSATLTPNLDSRFTEAPTAWPLHTSTLDVSTFNTIDLPGFYNSLNFTWLRGAKTILDDQTMWGVVGEQIVGQGDGDAVFGARYVSGFDSPPAVVLSPDYHPPTSPPLATILRGTSYLFDASQTNDTNLDPLTFIWTFAPASPFVTLTPIPPTNAKAELLVSRAIGGAAQSFTIGAVATTASHLAMDVTSIGISGNVLTVGTSAPVSLAATEDVFLFNIGTATFLNDLAFIVTGTSGNNFTANFVHADYSTTADTGNAIASPQFDYCDVFVPFNAAPTITFAQNPIAAGRNSVVTIVPTYTGVNDPDDATTYTWTQTSGTAVTVLGGTTSPTLKFNTNGVLISGDTLVWSLTVNDGVNPPITSTVTVNVAAFSFQIQDTLQLSRSLWGPGATISQRNTVQPWTPLDVSIIYTNFQNIKRTSILGGEDRYILISSASVCVYGGVNPSMALLRRLFVPLVGGVQNPIVDAVHTEDDVTLVLDSVGNLYRYSTAPFISTDNPDTVIVLSTVASMSFNKLFCTYSFNNARILILTGPDGCLLLQVNNTTLAVEGSLELTVQSGELYGIDNVQFVRTSNVEYLNTGKILLGTIALITANIQSTSVDDNTVTVEAENTFAAGQVITFQNMTYATFLSGVEAPIVSATPTQFVVSYEHSNYSSTPEGIGAIAVTGGATYETLIDLSHGQIIGTFDTSNLRNQYVTTGEILFEANDTYAGAPNAPVLNPIVNNGPLGAGYVSLTFSWASDRPDLVDYYDLEASLNEINWTSTIINSGYIESVSAPELAGQFYYFRIRAISADGVSPYSNIETISTGGAAPTPPTPMGFAIDFGEGFGNT